MMEKSKPNYFAILQDHVEQRRVMIESPDLDPQDKVMLKACCETSVRCAEDRGEITSGQREKLFALLNPTPIRLACRYCDREDQDGISEQALSAAAANGWRYIDQVQSVEDAAKTYSLEDAPAGFSALDWWTHLGVCPDCVQAGMD